MTLNTLLTFLVISQIAMSAYLLYSFNTIERASRKRHEWLAAHVDQALADLESRLTGEPRAWARMTTSENVREETSIAGGRKPELLHPGQA
jgi:hypothetical protein